MNNFSLLLKSTGGIGAGRETSCMWTLPSCARRVIRARSLLAPESWREYPVRTSLVSSLHTGVYGRSLTSRPCNFKALILLNVLPELQTFPDIELIFAAAAEIVEDDKKIGVMFVSAAHIFCRVPSRDIRSLRMGRRAGQRSWLDTFWREVICNEQRKEKLGTFVTTLVYFWFSFYHWFSLTKNASKACNFGIQVL